MKSLKLLLNFMSESVEEILANKKNYIMAFLALVLLGNVESSYPFIGVISDSVLGIVFTVISTLLMFVVLSQIVLIQKKKHGGTGELSFFVPTFLLYNLYYSFLFFLGIFLLVIPGLYVLIFFSLVPFIAVLDDETEGKFFKKSRELVKKNIGLVAWASVLTLVVELSQLLLSPIQDPTAKAVLTFVYSVPDAIITMVLAITMVKIFYYLKNA